MNYDLDSLIRINENINLERYMLFGFDHYDSIGGLGDLIGSFDDRSELEVLFIKSKIKFDVYQILDTQNGFILDIECPSYMDREILLNDICKKLGSLSASSHIESTLDDFVKLNPNFNKDEVISYLNKLIYSFKLHGFVNSYLDLEMLVNLLNRNKMNLFIEFLPIVIEKMNRDNRIPKSCISGLRSIV